MRCASELRALQAMKKVSAAARARPSAGAFSGGSPPLARCNRRVQQCGARHTQHFALLLCESGTIRTLLLWKRSAQNHNREQYAVDLRQSLLPFWTLRAPVAGFCAEVRNNATARARSCLSLDWCSTGRFVAVRVHVLQGLHAGDGTLSVSGRA